MLTHFYSEVLPAWEAEAGGACAKGEASGPWYLLQSVSSAVLDLIKEKVAALVVKIYRRRNNSG